MYLHNNPIPSINKKIRNIYLITLKLIYIDQITILYNKKKHNYNNT